MSAATDEPVGPEYRPPRLSLRLLRAARPRNGGACIRIGELIENLGEYSFGWSLLVFALVNMMPLPVGSNLITAVPLIILTSQMARGWHYVHVPESIARQEIDSAAFRRRVASVRSFTGRLERILRPRYGWLFRPEYYRAISLTLLGISLVLFLPIPGTGFILACAMFVFTVGLIAEDGLVALAGLCLGLVSVGVAITLVTLFVLGLETLL